LFSGLPGGTIPKTKKLLPVTPLVLVAAEEKSIKGAAAQRPGVQEEREAVTARWTIQELTGKFRPA